jgi:hypothetical protein
MELPDNSVPDPEVLEIIVPTGNVLWIRILLSSGKISKKILYLYGLMTFYH